MSRLASERNVWIATVRADGSPHLTPIWFVWVAGSFSLCTGASSVKVRNVERSPRVSLSLEDGDDPLVAEGDAVVHGRPYRRDVRAAFLAKYSWDIDHPDEDGPFDALVEVRPLRWLMGAPEVG